MKYNNIIPDELVRMPYNYITQTLERAENETAPLKRRELMYDTVSILYNEDRNSKTETRWICNGNKKLLVLAFNYNSRDYYWWDLLSSDGRLEASGLEIYPFGNDPTSFVIFATREGQSPFVWRENIRI